MQGLTHLVATSMISSLKYTPGLNLAIDNQDNVVREDVSSSTGSSYLSSVCGETDIFKVK